MDFLTVQEYADLKGCSEQYIRKLAFEGKLSAQTIKGRSGGNAGFSYQIPLVSIEKKYQIKWKRKQKVVERKPPVDDVKPLELVSINQEQLSAQERDEMALWKYILNEWQVYRDGKKKEDADVAYVEYLKIEHPTLKISSRTLKRKWKNWQEKGEMSLINKTGKHGNHKKTMQDGVFDIFEYYYLDQSQKSITKCMELTQLQLEKWNPALLPIPSICTFVREIEKRIPIPVLKYYRLGVKAFQDQCAPYIKRSYADLQSNDIWVCDNHTFDIFVNDGLHDKPVRIYLTGFLDVRSRKMMGWYVTDAPRSDATLYALRRGIEAYGIPKMIYSDNGREFLTFDIGGRGFRKTAVTSEHIPPTILQNLGIEFKTALVQNAKAKIIERAFLDVKEGFSKMFCGYTGGTIAERPERLKKTGKDANNFTALEEFVGYVNTYIIGIMNRHKHKGEGMHGKCPDQVFSENLIEQRIALKSDLDLMMLRNTRMIKVSRAGVSLKFYDQELFFNSDELLMNYIGEKVYIRYNPDDLNSVRLYDASDKFLLVANLRTKLSYFASKEDIKNAMHETRTLEKAVRAYKKQKNIRAEDELTLLLEKAAENMDYGYDLDPKIIIPFKSIESSEMNEPLKDVVNGASVIDLSTGIKRLKAMQEM